MDKRALVVGGGIAGIQAALDLAEARILVTVVERAPSIGGRMAQLDKTLPTNDCSICILSPNLVAAARHPNIEILTYSELVGLEGEAGDYRARVRRHPRYIDEDKCLACSECIDGCVYQDARFPNPFDLGLGKRKPIYVPFPQAVPAVPVIDPEACIWFKSGKCPRGCVEACGDRDAIDLDQQARDVELEVGAVIVATGFDEFDPGGLTRLGYGLHDNVFTGLEFERLLNAAGPTGGRVVRRSDGEVPRSILFVQCVGSRDQRANPFCSRICCTYAIKQCMIAQEHEPDIEDLTVAYIDLRTYGKGFEEYYLRGRDEAGIRFVRGHPAKILEEPDGDLTVFLEDADTRRPQQVTAGMVVLSSAMVSSSANPELSRVLGIGVDEHGFFEPRQINFEPTASTREGIFLAGCASSPLDIPDSVARASACAAHAARYLHPERVEEEPVDVEPVDPGGPPRIGVFVCHCGANIGGVVDVPSVADYARRLPDVAYAADNLFTCAEDTQKKIQAAIREQRLNRVVVAACSPRTHEPLFRDTCSNAGLNPYLFEMANIRDQCSWVHRAAPAEATRKARDLVRMAVARARDLVPLEPKEVDVDQRVLVVGGGIAGIEVALALARQGIEACIVEKANALGGRLRQLHSLYPDGGDPGSLLREKLDELDLLGVEVFLNAEIAEIRGFVGNFEADVHDRGRSNGHKRRTVRAGAVVLATGAGLHDPRGQHGYGRFPNVITSLELEGLLAAADRRPLAAHGLETATGRRVAAAGRLKLGARVGEPGGATGGRLRGGEPLQTVAFLQCVGARDPEGNVGCARTCCQTAIKQAIALRQRGVDVAIYYRDIRTFSKRMEEQYRRAREMGVLFLRYEPQDPPRVVGEERAERIVLFSPQLGEELELPIDALVLSVAMVPREEETRRLHQMLKVPLGPDGFFMERHVKLGPVETNTEGIFVCGCAQGPKDVADTVAQAGAAAAKVASLVCRDTKRLDAVTCTVDERWCRACGDCVDVCDFNAPVLIDRGDGTRVSTINPALCKGCGTCAARCPTGAIVANHFTDRQVESMIEALFEPDARAAAAGSA